MQTSTHTLEINPAGDCRLAPVRKTGTGYAGAPPMVTRVEPGSQPERAADEYARPHSHSTRIRPRLGELVEHALFAITLAGIGCFYLAAILTQAL